MSGQNSWNTNHEKWTNDRKPRPIQAQSAPQQLSLEFQKCEAMYKALELDRAATTLGFALSSQKSRHPMSAVKRQRPRTDTMSSRQLPRGHPRAKTAPGVLDAGSESACGLSKEAPEDNNSTTSPVEETEVRITPDVLIQLLNARGLGSPPWYRYPPPPPESATAKHYSSFRKVSYYMEKIKGRSRIDSDVAIAKASAFCEEQRQVMRAQKRSPSALFKSRFPDVYKPKDMFGEGRSFVGSKTDVNTIADTTTMTDGSGSTQKIVFRRIKTWIEDCEQAVLRENDKGAKDIGQRVVAK